MEPLDKCLLLLATGFGVGYAPRMPGTVGSLWGLVFVWGLQSLELNTPVAVIASAAIILAGVPICGKAANFLGRHDPGSVVWDEIAAFPIVFAGIELTWTTAIAGFVLFRLFDVLKPWPIRRFERLPAGWGIMADDLVAGIFAAACLQFVTRFLLPLI